MTTATDNDRGPATIGWVRVVTAPQDQPLALEYNRALAEVLRLLSDQELARMAVNLRCQKTTRPSLSNPSGLDLAVLKVEAEACERWNRRRGGNRWLACVLSDDLFVPDGGEA